MSGSSGMPPLTVEAAQALAVKAVRRLGAERVGLADAEGRMLQETVTATADVPPHDNSAMDGFAVRAQDVLGAAPERQVELEVIGEVAAGHLAARPVAAGQAMRIMTGAPIPAGADSVVMVEHTDTRAGRMRVLGAVEPGENIRSRGEDVRAGSNVLDAGQLLGAAEIGVLASLGRAQVRVARRPEVAILATGDELRDVGEPLTPGAIFDTNSYALSTLVRQAGGRPRLMPIVRDQPALLRAAVLEAASADLILSSGGVSVGEHDHVKAVLAELGARLELWRVAMKPGKPLALAKLGETAYFGLPGNPVSALVCFLLFVRPAILAALGAKQPFDLPQARAVLDRPLSSRSLRRSYLRARLWLDDAGELHAQLMPKQGSGVLTSMVGANGLVVIEEGAVELPAGAPVRAHIIGALAPRP